MTGNHYYIDLGGNKVTAHCYETDEWFEFKGEELFDWSISLPEGSILIGENAHFACPRSEKSKAQYFYAKDLLNWYSSMADNDISFYLFAQKDTEKFRRHLGLKKTDKNDIKSMAYAMHKAIPEMRKKIEHLQKPRSSFEPSLAQIEGDKMREQLTKEKNVQRFFNYNEDYHEDGGQSEYTDETVGWLVDNLEELAETLPADTAKAFGFDCIYTQKGELKKRAAFNKIKSAQVLGVLLTIMNLDGTLRVRPSTGRLSGWKFVKQYFFLEHPYRPKRGGVVRACLKWDGARHWIAKECGTKTDRGQPKGTKTFSDEDWANFKKYRNAFSKHTKVLWQTMRDMIVNRSSEQHSKEVGVHDVITN